MFVGRKNYISCKSHVANQVKGPSKLFLWAQTDGNEKIP